MVAGSVYAGTLGVRYAADGRLVSFTAQSPQECEEL